MNAQNYKPVTATVSLFSFFFFVFFVKFRLIESGTVKTLVENLATINDFMPDDDKSGNLNENVAKVDKNVGSMLQCLNLAMQNASKNEKTKLMKTLVDMKAHETILNSLKNSENNAVIGENATTLLLSLSQQDKNVLIELQSKNIVSTLSKAMAFNPNNTKLTETGSSALEVFSDKSILVAALKSIQQAADNKFPSQIEKEIELQHVCNIFV